MLQKFMKNSSKSEQAVNTKAQKDEKPSFPKEQIEITDLYKPILNKTMTTQEQCVVYNFVAPLTKSSFRKSMEINLTVIHHNRFKL